MKKVFSALVLTSFLAILLVPMPTFAADCSLASCDGENASGCNCGSASTDANYKWCNMSKGMVYSTRDACLAAGGVSSITTVPGLITKINTIGGYIRTILFAIAGIFLVVAGFYFVTAGGDPEKIKTARQMLINALVGVAVAVAATGLVALVQNIVA